MRLSFLKIGKVILSLFVVSVFCTRCIKIPYEETPITLSVSPSSLNFPSSGASQSFTVSSNEYWYIESYKLPSWLSITPTYGYNSAKITMVADRNTTSVSRNETITIISGVSGVNDQSISVTQAGAPTTAQIRFRKDGAYSDRTQLGIRNSSGTLVASYNFGSSSGTSNYYSVTAGTYYAVVYRSSDGWVYFYYSDGSLASHNLSAGYRYTYRLYRNNSGGYTGTLENDGTF